MNIDNQLLLGIVFITAGVAMGLLAYAAFLNRQQQPAEDQPDEEVEPEALEDEAEAEPTVSSDEIPQEAAQPPTTAPAAGPEPIAEPEPISGAEAETIAAASEESPDERGAETVVASPTTSPTIDRPSVLVDRDPHSQRLMIKVDERVYHSIEELQESDDWPRVTDLFSDLLAWMIKTEDHSMEESEQEKDTPDKPVSMVQEINSILGEKLAERESGPQAVRLMEGTGGSIRVYIGVESYSIDEVPDEEVQRLIRQAVSEWEERQ